MSIKSITITPERSLIFNCFAISSAASMFVFNAVFSMFDALVDCPECISIEKRAYVGVITI